MLSEEMAGVPLPHEPYFVDFLRDLPESAGDGPETSNEDEAPKVYEQVGDISVRAGRGIPVYEQVGDTSVQTTG